MPVDRNGSHGATKSLSTKDVFSVHGSRLPAPLTVPGAVVEVHERVDRNAAVPHPAPVRVRVGH